MSAPIQQSEHSADDPVTALGKVARWSERQRRYRAERGEPAARDLSAVEEIDAPKKGAWSEYHGRRLLERNGIPVVPAVLAADADIVVETSRKLGFPVVLKVCSPDILHKSDVGGIRLNLRNEDAVRQAFEEVMESVSRHSPEADVEGVPVSPMRSGGVEMLVGVVREPSFGQVLAIGIGGVFVEVLKDSSLRVLPVTRDDIRQMIGELKGAALLQGTRGAAPADMEYLVETIYRFSVLAQALGEELESLEINPLRVDGGEIEALDAVVTWRTK